MTHHYQHTILVTPPKHCPNIKGQLQQPPHGRLLSRQDCQWYRGFAEASITWPFESPVRWHSLPYCRQIGLGFNMSHLKNTHQTRLLRRSNSVPWLHSLHCIYIVTDKGKLKWLSIKRLFPDIFTPSSFLDLQPATDLVPLSKLEVDRLWFFNADTDTDYWRTQKSRYRLIGRFLKMYL